MLKSPGDISGSVFQPGEYAAQKKWIILAGSPADDLPNESPEKTPPSSPGQHDLGLSFHPLEDIGSHIKSFAGPKLSPMTTLVSHYTTGQ